MHVGNVVNEKILTCKKQEEIFCKNTFHLLNFTSSVNCCCRQTFSIMKMKLVEMEDNVFSGGNMSKWNRSDYYCFTQWKPQKYSLKNPRRGNNLFNKGF